MSSASSFHVIRSVPYVGGPRGCRCPMTRRHPMSASALRLAVPLHSLSYRCVAVRIHCTSALGTSVSPRVEAPRTYHIPLGSAPFNTLLFLSISQLCRSYPWCRIGGNLTKALFDRVSLRVVYLRVATSHILILSLLNLRDELIIQPCPHPPSARRCSLARGRQPARDT